MSRVGLEQPEVLEIDGVIKQIAHSVRTMPSIDGIHEFKGMIIIDSFQDGGGNVTRRVRERQP